MLWRPLRDSKDLDSLMPKTPCKSTLLGDGTTDFSISEMKKQAEKYSWQTENLADALAKSTLADTVLSFHDFLYNNLQYKADSEDQLLRSPACSWQQRETGIDCKSYSIFAASLCINLGITCYIRRIKQAGYAPTEFTHVYVIVPKNQTTGSLNNGYFTIDGTLKTTTEPRLVEKSDLKIEPMLHYALNGLGDPTTDNSGDEQSFLQKYGEKIAGFFKGVSLNSIFGFFSNLFSSAFDGKDIDIIQSQMQTFCTTMVAKINAAVLKGDTAELSKLTNEFFGVTQLLPYVYSNMTGHGWSSCNTICNFYAAAKSLIPVRDIYGKALEAWLLEYYNVSGSELVNYRITSDGYINGKYFSHWAIDYSANVNIKKYNFTPKGGEIKAFEPTPYLISAASGNVTDFVPSKYIASLKEVIVFAKDVANTNPNGGAVDTPIDPITGLPKPPATTAGGGAVGIILGLTALGFAVKYFSNMPDKGKK